MKNKLIAQNGSVQNIKEIPQHIKELYKTVWGAPLRADDRSVDVYIHKLRSKLALALPEWTFIHTHFGFGYRLHPEPSQDVHRTATAR